MMKITDVVIGQEYGVVERPKRDSARNYDELRQVKVLALQEIDESYYNRYSFHPVTRKVKVLKVKFLDESTAPQSSWYASPFDKAKKGSTFQLKARQLVALWSEISPGVLEAKQRERDNEAANDALEKRVKRLLGRSDDYVVQADSNGYLRGTFYSKTLDKLLTLAERGAEM